jgi:hypothetical protein
MAQLRKTILKSLWRIGLVLAAVLVLMNAGQARADIILNLASVMPMGSDFQYSYSVQLTDNTGLHAAGGSDNTSNFFTLFDVQGLVSGSVSVGGALAGSSTTSVQNSGLIPAGTAPLPPDNPNLPNITVVWTGSDVNGPFAMGTLTFLSANGLGSALLAFAGASQKLESFPNLVGNNIGQVAGPGPSVSPIPEPGTLMLLAMGLPVLGGLYYRRRN